MQHERDMRRQEGDQDTVAELSEYLKDLREIARQRMEGAAAVTLLRHDELTPTEEDPNVVLEARDLPGVRFAMWINLEKNQRPPRTISWPSLGLSLEVHRRIGSQILAIRVAQLRSGGPAGGARSRFLPLGGSLDVQLLAVPAPTKVTSASSLGSHCPRAAAAPVLPPT